MVKRTVNLAPEIENWLKNLAGELSRGTGRGVTLDEALNYMLAVAATRAERALASPPLSPMEIAQATALMQGEGINAEGFFDYKFPGSEKRYKS